MTDYDGGTPVGAFYGFTFLIMRGGFVAVKPHRVVLTDTQVLGILKTDIKMPTINFQEKIDWNWITTAAEGKLVVKGNVDETTESLQSAHIKMDIGKMKGATIAKLAGAFGLPLSLMSTPNLYYIGFNLGLLSQNSWRFAIDQSIANDVGELVKTTPIGTKLTIR